MIFEPFDLSEEITPTSIRATLKSKDYSKALVMALRLNEAKLTREVYESTPPNSLTIVVQTVSPKYVERLLSFIVNQVDTTPHIEFHLKWIEAILYEYGSSLQKRTSSAVSVLRSVQKAIGRKYEDIAKIFQYNRYTLQFAIAQGGVTQKRNILGAEDHTEDSEEEEQDYLLNDSSDSEMIT